jgi:hypothetical protein
MALETSKRINVTFPVSLLEELRHFMPSRQRNKFIPTGHDVVEATEKELAQIQLQSALAESAGAYILYRKSAKSLSPTA